LTVASLAVSLIAAVVVLTAVGLKAVIRHGGASRIGCQHRNLRCIYPCRTIVARFFLVQTYQNGEKYQVTTNYTKWPYLYQMAVKYVK
jgi:hypothetical protein